MNFRQKLLAAAFCTAMAGSVQASTVGSAAPVLTTGVPAYANGFSIAAEAVSDADYTVSMDGLVTTLGSTPAAQDITWVPSFGLNSGDIITFTFTGALFMDGNVKLVAEEATQPVLGVAYDVNADADTLDVVEVASNFGTVDTTNGVSSVQVRINNSLDLPTNITLLLQATVCPDTGPDGICDDATSNPTFKVATGTTGTVTVASSGVTSGGTAIPAATASGGIMDLETQFALTVSDAATSVSDVAAATPRTNFVDETAGNVNLGANANDSNLTQSSAQITLANDADSSIENFILVDAGDTTIITVTSSTNLDAISTTAGANFWSVNGSSVTNPVDLDLATVTGSTTALSNAAAVLVGAGGPPNFPAQGATLADDVILTVDGTTIIADRTFTTSGVLTFDTDFTQTSGKSYSLGSDVSHTWTTNGTILESTYTNTNPDFNQRFVLANTGTTAAPYSITCLVEAGNTCTPGAAGEIPANGVLVLGTTDVVSVTGTGNTSRATVVFTVEAPTTNIQGSTQTVKPGTGIEASQNMVRPGTN